MSFNKHNQCNIFNHYQQKAPQSYPKEFVCLPFPSLPRADIKISDRFHLYVYVSLFLWMKSSRSCRSINIFLPPLNFTTGISPAQICVRRLHTVSPKYSDATFNVKSLGICVALGLGDISNILLGHHRLLSIGFYFLNSTIYVNFHKTGDLTLNSEYQIFVLTYQASYLIATSISL